MGYECMMCMIDLDCDAPLDPSPSSSKRKPVNLSEVCGTSCGHMLHRACLNRWFKEIGRKICPCCREELSSSDIIRMYPPRASESNSGVGQLSCASEKLLDINERTIPPLNCMNHDCVNLLNIHKTLILDFNEIRTKYMDKVDEVNLLIAQNQSLEAEIAVLRQKNVKAGDSRAENKKREAPASDDESPKRKLERMS